MAMVRQADIAARLGLTQQAVAYALSSRPDYRKKLSSQTRQRVLDTARQLGYVPHRAARSLRRGRTDTVLVTTRAQLHHAHVHELLEALNEALMARGKEMLLGMSTRAETSTRVRQTLAGGGADALVMLGYNRLTLKELLPALALGLPKVMIGPGAPANLSTVEYDRVFATELATAHLLAQGHRDVALIYDVIDDLPSEERLRGYRQAMDQTGVRVDPSRLLRASAQEPDGAALWKRLRALQPRPTAAVCYNDELTLALLQTICAEGGRVPRDLALVTMNNTRLTRLSLVPLTTVDVDPPSIARTAVEVLMEQMENPLAPVRHERITPRLVVRASSGGGDPPTERP